MPPVLLSPDSDLSDFLLGFLLAITGFTALALVLAAFFYCFYRTSNQAFLDLLFLIPGQYDTQLLDSDSEHAFLAALLEAQRTAYLRAKVWTAGNPPALRSMGASYEALTVADVGLRGIDAFHFVPPALEQSPLLTAPAYSVVDRTELHFQGTPACALLNYSLPVRTRPSEALYFEVKLFSVNTATTTVLIGLASKPYPPFRLPGYNFFSLGYESAGALRINQPMGSPTTLLPRLAEADVVGIGFRPRLGVVFITHNGRKVLEAVRGLKLDMFPAIGVEGGPAVLQVNLGQSGFVFIEANVKRWGFATPHGVIGAPPVYRKSPGNEEVLDKGAEIPPEYPVSEIEFFSPAERRGTRPVAIAALAVPNTAAEPLSNPPSYKSGDSLRAYEGFVSGVTGPIEGMSRDGAGEEYGDVRHEKQETVQPAVSGEVQSVSPKPRKKKKKGRRRNH